MEELLRAAYRIISRMLRVAQALTVVSLYFCVITDERWLTSCAYTWR
jgi:hypothetical protein